MTKKFTYLVIGLSALATATVFGQDATSKGEGTLTIDKKSYTFTRALAYETTIDNEDAIAVVLSRQAIPNEKLKESREKDKESGDTDFVRPFLKLVFKKSGEFKHWSAGGGSTMLGRHSSKVAGELHVKDGRASGKASQPLETEGMFPTGFDVSFDVPLLKASDALPPTVAKKPGPAANVKPTVTGTFKGNGKDAQVAFVSAHWGEPFDGKPGIVLVFTEKDHSKDKKPDWNAAFGRFGSAMVISMHDDGKIYGCQVAHSAHKKQGFSSVGNIETNDFRFEDGKVEGEITTNGQIDTFGETWEVKLKFVAPLGEIPKEFQVPETKKEDKPASTKPNEKSAKTGADGDDDDDKADAQPKVAGLKVKELALTKDAAEVEYKNAVEHVLFKSKSDVKSVCAELAANLKAQGWTNDGPDMIQPQSSIMKRKRGAAKLTIFVKPATGGSQVQMFTEGLSW
ncbi:MAG: hypothetical protein QOI07_2344 [Verrucomicrobiota bacterium]